MKEKIVGLKKANTHLENEFAFLFSFMKKLISFRQIMFDFLISRLLILKYLRDYEFF